MRILAACALVIAGIAFDRDGFVERLRLVPAQLGPAGRAGAHARRRHRDHQIVAVEARLAARKKEGEAALGHLVEFGHAATSPRCSARRDLPSPPRARTARR